MHFYFLFPEVLSKLSAYELQCLLEFGLLLEQLNSWSLCFLDLLPALAVAASSKPAVWLAVPLLPWNTCPHDNCFVLSATVCLINGVAVLEIFLTCRFVKALIIAPWSHYTEGRTQLSSNSPSFLS